MNNIKHALGLCGLALMQNRISAAKKKELRKLIYRAMYGERYVDGKMKAGGEK